ncbi:hypothetical protein U1Q18_050078 [Sarracenia purpurea var. burkii]
MRCERCEQPRPMEPASQIRRDGMWRRPPPTEEIFYGSFSLQASLTLASKTAGTTAVRRGNLGRGIPCCGLSTGLRTGKLGRLCPSTSRGWEGLLESLPDCWQGSKGKNEIKSVLHEAFP